MSTFIEIGAILVASALAMIIHELPKSIVYLLTGRHTQTGDRAGIMKLYRYIDPVGWILFLTCHAGCSKPYPYRLKEKDTNVAIGLTGLLTLAVMIMGSYALFRLEITGLAMNMGWNPDGVLAQFLVQLNWYFIYASMVLLIVNLIPIMSSDISLLIIAFSPGKLISLLKNDTLIKGILLISIVFGWISALALQGMRGLDYLFHYI